ncbi:MAG TPA: outer membrane protein assembly factor BamD [Bacteroidales bacterium]|nr:outer membrane protein assembly factor BamD [Bacteroidales bacterium]
MKIRYIIFLVLALILVSCSQYSKLLKSTDYELKKNKAKEYFENGDFSRVTQLLEQIIPRYRATDEAEDLTWMSAQSYYGMKDFMMAGAEFRNYANLYPYGKHDEEANFLAAMCDYYQSPRPELDQASTTSAIESFSLFISKYPSSQRAVEAKNYVKEMKDKLSEKSYLSARLYYRMDQYKAAVTALSNSLKEFPETKFRHEMMFLKLNSLYLYAVNSIPSKQTERFQSALDDYYSFIEEFPKTSYSKDLARIYQATTKALKINIDQTQTNSK